MMISTSDRLDTYPFELQSELRDAANGHGYRIGPEQAGGGGLRSATAPAKSRVAAHKRRDDLGALLPLG